MPNTSGRDLPGGEHQGGKVFTVASRKLDLIKFIFDYADAMSREATPIVHQLRARGMRVTAARHAVLEWLAKHPHATVEHVHEGVIQQLGSISKQAVYDVLKACLEADLVQQIKPAGHPARFERRTGDNHHHLVCRRCGRIEDVDCAVGAKPCLNPDHDHGFEIDEAEVMYWGLCGACLTAATATPDDDHSRQ